MYIEWKHRRVSDEKEREKIDAEDHTGVTQLVTRTAPKTLVEIPVHSSF